MKIKLSQPLIVDGVEQDNINLDIESLTARDMITIEETTRMFKGSDFQLWGSEHLLHIAARASGITFAELQKMCAKDFMKVQLAIVNFFNDINSPASTLDDSDMPF